MGSAKRKPKVATGQTINPTAWQTAALGVEGSAALKRRQQRPITGPDAERLGACADTVCSHESDSICSSQVR